jgi:hypothetical protein
MRWLTGHVRLEVGVHTLFIHMIVRTLPLALKPVNQIVTPFWLSNSERSFASTEPGERRRSQAMFIAKSDHCSPLWKVMLVAIVYAKRWTSDVDSERRDRCCCDAELRLLQRSYIALSACIDGLDSAILRFGSIDATISKLVRPENDDTE